jgi:hypothetical protein
MLKDLTFKDVCKFIKEDDASLIDSVDKLMGVAILLSPMVFGPQALTALGFISAKNELTRLSKSLLEKLIAKKETDFLARIERMQMAYGFICYTAFFEALDRLLPEDLRKRIALQPSEKQFISGRAANRVAKQMREDQTDLEIKRESTPDILLPFPHPVSTYQEQTAQLRQLYDHMAKGFSEFLQKLAIGEERNEKTLAQIRDAIQKLPDTALKCFESQYFALAEQYQDFCLWSRLHEYKTTQHELKNLSDYVKRHAILLTESEKRIDIGFDKLQKTVRAIPDQFKAVEAVNIMEGLRRHYEARINEPIIEDKYESDQSKPALKFPKIAEAFIPQSYRVLRYISKDRHLEKEESWKDLDAKYDLGAFMLSYLSSPYSIETPLVVLGHPGSGKSLLTKILCARLMSESYTPIRVPLREVDADSPIESQIEEEIHHITGNRISSWANFSGQFSQRPLVIFLDGYDELLQASGKVFAGYLKTIQQFQQREAEQGRPVRVIVTSRLALIDKATIPQGSTILRLLEFNEKQRAAWIRIWNKTNAEYFQSSAPPMEPFEIPEEKKILELAEQPLLLLMLALYDSDRNSLRQKTILDRTILYDSLLRRFVSRELGKNREYDSLANKEKQEQIDREMIRLGVAAIGMYNRRKLHIQAAELDSDLGFFELERPLKVQNGRPMTQADILLGSFFFIHKSRAGGKDREDYTEHDTAFEFLHNTFGEFLTADFVLRYTFQETEALHTYKQTESLRAELQRKLQNPDGLVKEWFTCLMYAPLYSRPVVVEMLREWTNHMLQRKGRSREDFLASLDEILLSQIAMILKRRNLPLVMRTDEAGRFSELSLLDHLAIYTLNLIIIRTVLDKNEFVFDEHYFTSSGDDTNPEAKGARPWDKLTYLWRSCFTLENLNGLTSVLAARRED